MSLLRPDAPLEYSLCTSRFSFLRKNADTFFFFPTHSDFLTLALRMINVGICNHQADVPLYVWPGVGFDDLREERM